MEIISFYYDEEFNVMEDINGEIVYDIYRYISPSMFSLFKEREGTYYIKDPNNPNVVYEFVFPITCKER